jgi:hypothetical protein
MVEEYTSIMRNDVWGIFSILKGNSVMIDAGASLHVSQPASQPRRAHAFNAEERRSPHLLF